MTAMSTRPLVWSSVTPWKSVVAIAAVCGITGCVAVPVQTVTPVPPGNITVSNLRNVGGGQLRVGDRVLAQNFGGGCIFDAAYSNDSPIALDTLQIRLLATDRGGNGLATSWVL